MYELNAQTDRDDGDAPARLPLDDAFGIERPATFLRLLVELLFYITFFNSAFLFRLGLNQIPYLLGGIVAISGMLCIAALLLEGERLGITFWTSVLVWIAANLSQVFANGEPPIFGDGLSMMLFFVCLQAMNSYICLNDAARKRVLAVISVTSIAVMALGSEAVGTGKVKRLQASADFISSFSNSNSVAYICGFACIAALFWSLRARQAARPILWAISLALAVITALTLSRTGVILLGLGLLMVVVAILLARGTRVGGIVLLIVAVAVVSQLAYLFSESLSLVERRFATERANTESRLFLYDLRTIGDLASTTPLGRGPRHSAMTSTGIEAHNTFVYIHMAFGAIAAWPLLIWQIVLGLRVLRMLRTADYPIDVRIMVLTFYAMILGEYMTNNFASIEASALYGTAVIDKYTSPYRRSAIAQRQHEQAMMLGGQGAPTWARRSSANTHSVSMATNR